MASIKKKKFKEINLIDNFFDSLRADYTGFDIWFNKKSETDEDVFVLEEDKNLQAFLYMKIETEEEKNINPPLKLTEGKILKVGTFKINAHGTKLGERFVKLIFDRMIEEKIRKSYVTIFKKHSNLISLLEKYGFTYWGKKDKEDVYVKNFDKITGDIQKDYPLIKLEGNNKFILSIYPTFHTRLFPDSQLRTERNHVVEDLSYTNSIEKVYLSGSRDLLEYRNGDIVVIYRTAEAGYSAEYSSVLTSICTLKEIININDFNSEVEFLEFCVERTIFTEKELRGFWREKRYPYIITLLYNIALNKRIIRKEMIEEIGINRMARIVAYEITNSQMKKILEMGRNDKDFITY